MMSYKPWQISRTFFSRNAEQRLRRDAKKAARRIRRQLERRRLDDTPPRIQRLWIY